MRTSTKFIIISVLFAIIAFSLSRMLWPSVPLGMPEASTSQQPFFTFLSVIEALAFGVGIAFAFLGWKYVKAVMPENRSGAMWSFVAIIWSLISWWPHDNMHRVNPPYEFGRLLGIEYIFHFTLIIAGFILARNFWKLVKPKIIQ